MLHAVSEARRQFLYHKVLQSFQVAITVCDAIPKLPHFKRPPAKISTHRLFSDFIEESNSEVFDIVVDGFPWELQSHELISMVWYSWPASSISFAAINLDPKTSLYFEFNDTEENHLHFLAVAEELSIDLADEIFVRELFMSNGETFHTGVLTSPPNEMVSHFSRSTLVEFFLAIADRAIDYGGTDFWEEVLNIIDRRSRLGFHSAKNHLNVSSPSARRRTIERYLACLLSS
jgi:hypothetical protein